MSGMEYGMPGLPTRPFARDNAAIAAASPFVFAPTWYYYANTSQSGTANTTPTQNRTYAMLMFLRAGTLASIGIDVGTGGASSTCRLGIFEDLDGLPGALLLDAGTISTTGTGVMELTILQPVRDARYWFTFTQQGGTPPLMRGWSDSSASAFFLPFGLTPPSGNIHGVLFSASTWTGALGPNFTADGIPVKESSIFVKMFFRYAA